MMHDAKCPFWDQVSLNTNQPTTPPTFKTSLIYLDNWHPQYFCFLQFAESVDGNVLLEYYKEQWIGYCEKSKVLNRNCFSP